MTRTNPDGFDHIGNRVQNGASDTRLNKQEAREQLLHDLRDQIGPIVFSVISHDDDSEEYGDGTVIAKIGGVEADHYVYHDLPPWEDRETATTEG